jgi:transposase
MGEYVGTSSTHFLSYLSSMMDCLDRNGLHGYYFVMDNAPIHKPAAIRGLIERRGYKCVYLPPYSPFLDHIEEFWSKVKSGIKRNPLDTGDLLTPRMAKIPPHPQKRLSRLMKGNLVMLSKAHI